MRGVSALILAGNRPEGDPLAVEMGVPAKALIDVGGKPMLTRVMTALSDAGVQHITVSASVPEVVAVASALGCTVIPAHAGPSASANEAFRLIDAPMLLTTADHALLKPDWVRYFLTAHQAEADLSVMLARRGTIERDAPTSARSYLRLADGEWSGCNLFYFATPVARRALDLWSKVEADRKRPWRIAARLGPGLFVQHLFRRLGAAETIARLGACAGLRAGLVESPFGLAAVDVDSAEDLAFARSLVG